MDFAHYQTESRKTAMYPGAGEFSGLAYCVLGLAGEAGEVGNVTKKIWRDKEGVITSESIEKLKGELSDVLWYLANACTELGLSLSDVAEYNLEKLFSRKARGTICGSGDTR